MLSAGFRQALRFAALGLGLLSLPVAAAEIKARAEYMVTMGGTHVANTREVGGIRVTGYESKGRINKRIRIELTDPN